MSKPDELEEAERRLKAAYDQYWAAQTLAQESAALDRIRKIGDVRNRLLAESVPHYAGITG